MLCSDQVGRAQSWPNRDKSKEPKITIKDHRQDGHAAQSWPHKKIVKPMASKLFASSESHSDYKGEWKGVETQGKHAYQAKLAGEFHAYDNLDDAGVERLSNRMESRAQDSHYSSLMTSYFPHLKNCEHVVELGCGTGVVLRALLQDSSFKGRVTGLDQSLAFLKVAQRAAAAEGLDKDRYFFEVSDATTEPKGACGDLTAKADAIICHTLLAHVNDPAAVLASARKLAKPGALLVVMDGDYGSVLARGRKHSRRPPIFFCALFFFLSLSRPLTLAAGRPSPQLAFSHEEDPALGRRVDQAITQSVYASPDVVRRLPSLLEQTGWQLESATGQCLSEVGASSSGSFWAGYAEAYLPSIRSSGLVSEKEIDGWWAAQQRSIKAGHFFAAANYFTLLARATS